jgi:hypothetical protein
VNLLPLTRARRLTTSLITAGALGTGALGLHLAQAHQQSLDAAARIQRQSAPKSGTTQTTPQGQTGTGTTQQAPAQPKAQTQTQTQPQQQGTTRTGSGGFQPVNPPAGGTGGGQTRSGGS